MDICEIIVPDTFNSPVIPKRTIFCPRVILVCLVATAISFGAGSETSEAEKQEYKRELMHIITMRKSLKPGKTNDLQSYKEFADVILKKWRQKNKEHYARLILEACKPLSSGQFNDNRQHDVARRYALSALDKPEEISIEMELELTGHVVTLMYTPNSPKSEDFAQRRKKDVEIRLHSWKRLIDAIDPNWDPNDLPVNKGRP